MEVAVKCDKDLDVGLVYLDWKGSGTAIRGRRLEVK